MNKNKIYMYIGLFILLVSTVGSIGTYALFTWSSTDNTSVTLSIGELADVTFNAGPDIKVNNLSPVYNYTDGESTTFSITNKDTSGSTLRYTVNIDINKIDTPLVSKDFKYKLISGTNIISEGDFSTAIEGSSINIAASIMSSTKVNFTLYLYIDGNMKNNPNIMNQTFTSKINVGVTEGDPALTTLTNLGLSVDTSHTPDFTTVSGNSGIKYDSDNNQTATGLGDNTNGVYKTEDDLGNSYYFRGDVQNNYVYFAKNWFRIIRINGDGTIRMIYTSNPNDSSSSEYLNKNNYNYHGGHNNHEYDNAYVGYMYGTIGSSTYEATHTNTNNSTIKGVIDTWYQNNLSSYSTYIADAIYCNDRETIEGDGIGFNSTIYASSKRNKKEHNPKLKCTNRNDKFTVDNTIGNGALTYPIGLITTDEVVLSGGYARDKQTGSYITNNSYFLYPKNGEYWYWTMTPNHTDSTNSKTTLASSIDFIFYIRLFSNVYVDVVDSKGTVSAYSVVSGLYESSGQSTTYNGAVRPVISLVSNAITGGDGTEGNPFYVNEEYSS